MGSATCGFDRWLDDLDQQTRAVSLVPALDAIAHAVAEAFGARVWFVEILGKRWSYVAGTRGDSPVADTVTRLVLAGAYGLVAETWGDLTPQQRDRFVAMLEQRVCASPADGDGPKGTARH